MSYPLTQSTGSIIRGAGWVKRLIHNAKKFFGLIVLDLCINVHSCFAVFMSGKVLNRLGVNACIKQICNIGMPELMGRHFKIQGKELPELRASLETINKAAGELIADIDRHYKVICKERGIDLAAQSEQTVPQQEAASEAEVPMQAPARHAYKLHSNFERTSPADSTYIQEYTVADDLSLIPGEVVCVCTAMRARAISCISLSTG